MNVGISKLAQGSRRKLVNGMDSIRRKSVGLCIGMRTKLVSERAQGTTEYAILVGVLVVIAILAITLFRPKLEELWNAIANGINSL